MDVGRSIQGLVTLLQARTGLIKVDRIEARPSESHVRVLLLGHTDQGTATESELLLPRPEALEVRDLLGQVLHGPEKAVTLTISAALRNSLCDTLGARASYLQQIEADAGEEFAREFADELAAVEMGLEVLREGNH